MTRILVIILALCVVAMPTELLAQLIITTCYDRSNGRDCFTRPYDRSPEGQKRFRDEERQFRRRLDRDLAVLGDGGCELETTAHRDQPINAGVKVPCR